MYIYIRSFDTIQTVMKLDGQTVKWEKAIVTFGRRMGMDGAIFGFQTPLLCHTLSTFWTPLPEQA